MSLKTTILKNINNTVYLMLCVTIRNMVTMKYLGTTLIYMQYLWMVIISEINEDFHVTTKSKQVAETIKHI